MKIALLVCKGQIAVDTVITETNLTLSQFFAQYALERGYNSYEILSEDHTQLRVLIQTDSSPIKTIDNTLGVLAFNSN